MRSPKRPNAMQLRLCHRPSRSRFRRGVRTTAHRKPLLNSLSTSKMGAYRGQCSGATLNLKRCIPMCVCNLTRFCFFFFVCFFIACPVASLCQRRLKPCLAKQARQLCLRKYLARTRPSVWTNVAPPWTFTCSACC